MCKQVLCGVRRSCLAITRQLQTPFLESGNGVLNPLHSQYPGPLCSAHAPALLPCVALLRWLQWTLPPRRRSGSGARCCKEPGCSGVSLEKR